VGSCNTVFPAIGGFQGANTDVPGFIAPLIDLVGGRDEVGRIGEGNTNDLCDFALDLHEQLDLALKAAVAERNKAKAQRRRAWAQALRRKETCPQCHGGGRIGVASVMCGACMGTGRRVD